LQDALFVLQSAMDRSSKADTMEDRMAYTMSSAGASITVASLTNVAGFLIGSNTSLPALRAFSLYAALAMLFDLLLQVVTFIECCESSCVLPELCCF
jgi:Niemann-Pick C1 protein